MTHDFPKQVRGKYRSHIQRMVPNVVMCSASDEIVDKERSMMAFQYSPIGKCCN